MEAGDPPVTQPPPGEAADPTRPESLAPYNTLCQAACLSMATIAVMLRMFTTGKITKKWRPDDCKRCGDLQAGDADGGR